MPVVDEGKLQGIVTSRDFRYADNMEATVSTIMTPFEKLVTVEEGFSQEDVMKLMYNNRIPMKQYKYYKSEYLDS